MYQLDGKNIMKRKACKAFLQKFQKCDFFLSGVKMGKGVNLQMIIKSEQNEPDFETKTSLEINIK